MRAIQLKARICPPLRGSSPSGNRKISLVRGETERAAVRAYFSRHKAFRPGSKADQNCLARPELGNAVAAQGLHVHEYIGRPFATGEKTEPAQAVEPLYLSTLEAACRCHRDVGARWRHLRRVYRCTFVHRHNPKGLQTLRALQHL